MTTQNNSIKISQSEKKSSSKAQLSNKVSKSISLEIDKNGIANLVFDLPKEKVNKLSAIVLTDFEKKLDEITKNESVKILVISSNKSGNFIAGADINEIKSISSEKDAYNKVSQGQNIITKLSNLKIPTIAIISGSCLGGGLELALACDYRLATTNSKAILGLPEVNLGIIPGFGGTQRLPRIVGLQQSLSMILSGKSINAKKSLKIGLVNAIINESFLKPQIDEFIEKVLSSKIKVKSKKPVLEKIPFGKSLIINFAFNNLSTKTNGKYPAPHYALEVIRRTYGKDINKGLKIEIEAFCELAVGEVCKNMIELFFTNEALKKDNGLEGKNAEIIKVKKAAVVGAGIMGGGIVWLFAKNDIDVRLKDIAQKAISIGYSQINKIFSQLKKIRKLTKYQISLKTSKVSSTLDYSGFNNRDLIIEAVIEDIKIKKKIFSEIEGRVSKEAIIASNTSSLSINEMAKSLKNPSRFIGMHFFNPVNRMPLVEVIKGEKTDDKTIASTVALAKNLGKTPIVVKDVAGFLVNRILLPYLNESAYILQESGDMVKIDSLIEDFGMPMGPFTLADVVGIDVGVKVARSLQESYGTRMKVAEILNEIYDNHKDLLGKKSKIGFYKYSKETKVNKNIYSIVSKLVKKNKIKKLHHSDSEIVDRCILIMVNESAKCLEEGVVQNARYLDMAMIMGAGFPAFRGGVLRYADNRGLKDIVKKLEDLNKKYGQRFEASKLLTKLAKEDKKFYDQ